MRQVDNQERPPTLGEPIRKPDPTRPEWVQVDGAPKGIEQHRDGKLRNSAPTPPPEPVPRLPGWPLFKKP